MRPFCSASPSQSAVRGGGRNRRRQIPPAAPAITLEVPVGRQPGLSLFDRDRPHTIDRGGRWGRNYCRDIARHHRVKERTEAPGFVCVRRPARGGLQAGRQLGLAEAQPARHPGRKSRRRSGDPIAASRGPFQPGTNRKGGNSAAQFWQPRDLTRRSAAAVDGHDRRIFTGTCRPRSGHVAGQPDRRRNRCLTCYDGSPWHAATIDPSTSCRWAAEGRAGSHFL